MSLAEDLAAFFFALPRERRAAYDTLAELDRARGEDVAADPQTEDLAPRPGRREGS